MNKMLEPWGFEEENNYESLQSQSSTSEKNQNEKDESQWAAIKKLEDSLNAEIIRSTGKDEVHDSDIATNKGGIETNAEAIAKKADETYVNTKLDEKANKEHTHEITDLRQGGNEDIVLDANATYETTPKN